MKMLRSILATPNVMRVICFPKLFRAALTFNAGTLYGKQKKKFRKPILECCGLTQLSPTLSFSS
jgi:hypothetical protein